MYNGLKTALLVLRKAAGESVKAGNTQLGAAIIASGLTYILTKGSKEKENEELKDKIDAMETKLEKKEIELRDSDKEIQKLLDSKIKSNAMLATCQTQRSLYRYAHENSLCFWRQNYSTEAEERPVVGETISSNKITPQG